MRLTPILTKITFVCLLSLVPALAGARARFSWDDHKIIDKKWPDAVETSTGLRYFVIEEGKGVRPQPGDTVSVLYRGLLINGTPFDESTDPEKPFTFKQGRGEVIKGWDEAIAKMSVGAKFLIIVPAELAYGTRGRPPSIPRSAALVFEVEMLKIVPVG